MRRTWGKGKAMRCSNHLYSSLLYDDLESEPTSPFLPPNPQEYLNTESGNLVGPGT